MFQFDRYLNTLEWMRPPGWRWNVILGYLADPTRSFKNIRRDTSLVSGADFIRIKKISENGDYSSARKYPAIQAAQDIFNHSSFAGWRWFVEALIISGAPNSQIQDLLKVDISDETLNIYRKLWFDVESYIHSEAAVHANILASSRLSMSGKMDCDYTWKMFAFTWGPDAFMDQFASKKRVLKHEYGRWFKDLTRDSLTITAFQLSSDLRKNYNMEALDVLKVAKDYWNISEQELSKTEEMVDEDFISSLQSHVTMVMMGAEANKSKVEKRSTFNYN